MCDKLQHGLNKMVHLAPDEILSNQHHRKLAAHAPPVRNKMIWYCVNETAKWYNFEHH